MIAIAIIIEETNGKIEAKGGVIPLPIAHTKKEDEFSLKVHDVFSKLLIDTMEPGQTCNFFTRDRKKD